jgi:hypothetical protein
MDKWAHLGHTLGECWVDSNKNVTYINIPKNASTFIKRQLINTNGFIHSDILIHADQYLIVLRDPIERWISAVAQLLTAKDNHMSYDKLANIITTDDHTETQTYFLQNVEIDKCIFFMVNSNLSKNLQQWLDNNGYKMNVSHLTNQGDQNIKKYVISEWNRVSSKN